MNNSIKYGLWIGIMSGIWLLIMHFSGVYSQNDLGLKEISWMEYVSVLIPFLGLYLGVKHYRDHLRGGTIEFFEGLFEGFKIMLIAGIIVAFLATIYIQYTPQLLKIDFMGRVGGAGVVGILLNIMVSLCLMNKQRNL